MGIKQCLRKVFTREVYFSRDRFLKFRGRTLVLPFYKDKDIFVYPDAYRVNYRLFMYCGKEEAEVIFKELVAEINKKISPSALTKIISDRIDEDELTFTFSPRKDVSYDVTFVPGLSTGKVINRCYAFSPKIDIRFGDRIYHVKYISYLIQQACFLYGIFDFYWKLYASVGKTHRSIGFPEKISVWAYGLHEVICLQNHVDFGASRDFYFVGKTPISDLSWNSVFLV